MKSFDNPSSNTSTSLNVLYEGVARSVLPWVACMGEARGIGFATLRCMNSPLSTPIQGKLPSRYSWQQSNTTNVQCLLLAQYCTLHKLLQPHCKRTEPYSEDIGH
jgi:hypothetical protein